MPRPHRPGSSLPSGRNYQGNRFGGLMPKKGKKKKGKAPPFAKGKKPKVPPQAMGLAMAMRGNKQPFFDKA